MMIRSLWRGLGRNTPAPKRSMSNLPAPVAIISIAQHASPNVIGHSADLRAQLTTGEAMSIALAATVRRTKFLIEATVVRTKPSLCSGIDDFRLPNSDKDEPFNQRELREREIVAHEDDRPGQEKDRLDVED